MHAQYTIADQKFMKTGLEKIIKYFSKILAKLSMVAQFTYRTPCEK